MTVPTPLDLHDIAAEMIAARNLIHRQRNDGRPWSPSLRDSAKRRLHHLSAARDTAVLAEVTKGHDPVQVAHLAQMSLADVARLLARQVAPADPPSVPLLAS